MRLTCVATRLSRVHDGLMCGARGLTVGAIKVLGRVALARRFGGGEEGLIAREADF
jgi:hypothetical protein